jgi:WD40 repeat protein
MFSPQLLYQLTFEGLWPSSVCFLDSWQRVVAGNQEGKLYVWELPETPPEAPPPQREGDKSQRAANVWPRRQLVGHENCVSKLLYDSQRKRVISASFDYSLCIWDVEAPSQKTADAVLDGEARRSEFKRTKKQDVLDAPGVPVEVIGPARKLAGHPDWVGALAASADFSRLISGDHSANVIVWDVERGEPLAKWRGHAWNWIVAAALTPDGQAAVVSEFRYKRDDFDIPTAGFKVWNAGDGTEKLDILQVHFPKIKVDDTSYGGAQGWKKFTGDGLVALAISPDGKLIAAGQGGEIEKGIVHMLELETGKLVRDVSGHQYGVTDVCFSKDGTLLFTAGRDTCVRIMQVDDGKELAVLGSPRGGQFKDWISAIALSPDEQYLAAADISGHVAVWKLKA